MLDSTTTVSNLRTPVVLRQVMNKGGYAAVTAASGWPDIAFELQRDSELADIVQAVYQCYLHPLELDIPYGFR